MRATVMGMVKPATEKPMSIQPTSGNFVAIQSLRETDALPAAVLADTVALLPEHLVQVVDREIRIHPALAASYHRVVNTDFSKKFWHLNDEQDVEDTVNWCALGGSFLADFAMDATRPRIFAWGLNPTDSASHYALNELKGRDPEKIPTAACIPASQVADFLDAARMPITREQIADYLALGPAGIRIAANQNVPRHYIHNQVVQFILPGLDSPYAKLVKKFMDLSRYTLMGVTSGNFSSKGKYAERSGGTHKNLDEIQACMGFLGIPILAGPIESTCMESREVPELYKQLHRPYAELAEQEKEDCLDLLPTSVTVVNPGSSGKVWDVARHGSLHYSILQEVLEKYGIEVVVKGVKRLDIGLY